MTVRWPQRCAPDQQWNKLMSENKTYTGGCHCGAVRFRVDAPAKPDVLSCTCSMCATTGFLHLIVDDSTFRITAGKDMLSEYRFNTKVARHFFCKVCGVKPFYVPRSHPDGWSVNARCVDSLSLDNMTITEFDGANWEANVENIR